MLQVGTGDDLDLVLTKLAVSENVANMLPIDGSSIGTSYEVLSVSPGAPEAHVAHIGRITDLRFMIYGRFCSVEGSTWWATVNQSRD